MANTGTVTQWVNPYELVNFVRLLDFFNVDGEGTLQDDFPTETVPDIQYRYTKGQLVDQQSASYRAWDAEAPIAKRQGFGRQTGELAPISRKIQLGEELRHRLRQAETGDYSQIVDQVFNDAANMARSVRIRLEMARGELISNGTVTLSENGVSGQYDAGVPSGNKVTPAVTNWNDPSADILGDLTAWITAYRLATRGLVPSRMKISTTVLTYMLKNTAIRQLAGNIIGSPLAVTREQLSQVLNAYALPTFEVDDRAFTDVTGSTTRVIAANKVILLPPKGELGATLLGTPAEALSGVRSGFVTLQEAPGVWAQTWEENDPMVTWTLATAIGLPIMANPFLVYIATVY